MPELTRSRSVSRSRITVIDPGDPENECVDPNQLLEQLLTKITSLEVPLMVELTDGVKRVNYPIKVFTSKLWPIRNEDVMFGLVKLQLKHLKEFEEMNSKMCLMWKDHTVQNTVVLVRIDVYEKDFLRLDVKVSSGNFEESVMLITVKRSPLISDNIEVNLQDIVSQLCSMYRYLSPSTSATYYDEVGEDEIKCPRSWLTSIHLNQNRLKIHGNTFETAGFVIEIPLKGHL